MRSTILAPIALIIASGLSPATAAESNSEKVFDSKNVKELRVDVAFHDVVVNASSGNEIQFRVRTETSGHDAEDRLALLEPRYEQDGKTLRLRIEEKRTGFWGWLGGGSSGSGQGRVEIELPAGIDFQIDTASGDCGIDGDFARASAVCDTASGDVEVSAGLGRFDADTASGSVRASLRGPVDSVSIDTASGDVEVEGDFGDFHADTASGDVSAEWASAPPAGSKILIDTASGDVKLSVPEGTTLDGGISTASGGVRSSIDGAASEDGDSMRFTGGSDALQISIDTASGGVSIKTW